MLDFRGAFDRLEGRPFVIDPTRVHKTQLDGLPCKWLVDVHSNRLSFCEIRDYRWTILYADSART